MRELETHRNNRLLGTETVKIGFSKEAIKQRGESRRKGFPAYRARAKARKWEM